MNEYEIMNDELIPLHECDFETVEGTLVRIPDLVKRSGYRYAGDVQCKICKKIVRKESI